MEEFFAGLRVTLRAFLELHQYKALALLIGVEEAGVPLPLPGDLAIAFMGYQVSLGRANPVTVVLVTIASATAGASLLYWIARVLGGRLIVKVGGFLHLTPERQIRIEAWFDKYDAPVIIFGRLVPGLRIAVAAAAGIAKVNFWKFFVYTAISATIWAVVYTSLGWALGRHYRRLESVVHRLTGDPLLGLAVLVGLAALAALAFVYGLWRRQRAHRPIESGRRRSQP